jgi:hypothetical protein
MRWYGIDELDAADTEKLRKNLTDMELASGVDGLFWLPIPEAMLSALQREHGEHCGPYVMGLEVEKDSLRLELLVRARGRIHCNCVAYADSRLQQYMFAWLENLLKDLHIAC